MFQAARMAYRWPWQFGLGGLGTTGLGIGMAELGIHGPYTGYLIPAGLAAYAGSTGWWWLTEVARPHSTRAAIARRARHDQYAGGVASRLDIAEHASPAALRARAHVLRPSLAGLSRRQRRRLDPTQLGVEVARLGWGLWGERLYVSCEDATLRVSPPRAGKTASMANHGEDAPGALITTSTRLDLAEMVHATRSRRGRVHFFNPAGLGGLESTVRWRVLSGCEDFTTAQRRAGDLIPESAGEAQRWDDQARRVLALLLHAAELTGRGMRDVMRWISDITDATVREVTDALIGGPGTGGRDRAAAARAFYATNDRTRSSITSTMSIPLAWMSDDRARYLGDAPAGAPGLIDIATLIERQETLHLLGHEDQGGLSPLIGALVAEIGHAARTLAARRTGGRLDPPLTMDLDEAALVCPIPLPRWLADMGGRGVTMHISVQSLSQLRERWGTEGAATILDTVGCFIAFGGSTSADDLRDLSLLTGEYRMKVEGDDHSDDSTSDGEKRGEYRWVPVMTPAQIRALGPFEVLVLRRFLRPVIAWVPKIFDRKGWHQVTLSVDTPTTQTARPVLADDVVPSTAELEAMLDDGQPGSGRGMQ